MAIYYLRQHNFLKFCEYQMVRSSFLALIALIVQTSCFTATAATKQRTKRPNVLTTEQVCNRALSSVVELKVRDGSGEISKTGSGFVVGSNLLATNYHVIENAHVVSALFQNGRSEVVYGIVGSDERDDLVIVYVNTGNATPLHLERKSLPRIGEDVIAIGCPDGFENSVSRGIVSGIRRFGSYKLIQTDAAISHGSSGGPLLNMQGNVIGVTSYSFSDAQNVNFAIPSGCVIDIIPNTIKRYRPWGATDWVATSDSVTVVGRIGTVSVEEAEIHAGKDKDGYLLSTVPKGTKLVLAGQTDSEYAVLMIDRTYGFIQKSDVQLSDTPVIAAPALPSFKHPKHR